MRPFFSPSRVTRKDAVKRVENNHYKRKNYNLKRDFPPPPSPRLFELQKRAEYSLGA